MLSNHCAAVLTIANDGNKQGRFDSTKVLLCYSFQVLKTNRGGSIAPNFLKGFLSENLVLSNPALLCYPLRILTTNMGGSVAPNFVKGFL